MKKRKTFIYSKALKVLAGIILFASIFCAAATSVIIVYKDEVFGAKNISNYDSYMMTDDFSEVVSYDMFSMLEAVQYLYEVQPYKNITFEYYDNHDTYTYNLSNICDWYGIDLFDVLNEEPTYYYYDDVNGSYVYNSDEAATEASATQDIIEADLYDSSEAYDIDYSTAELESEYAYEERFLCVTAEEFMDIVNTYTQENNNDISMNDLYEIYLVNDYNEPNILDTYMNEEGKWRYDITIDSEFGDCLIYKYEDQVFVYSYDDALFYNSNMGWFGEEDIYRSEYIYIPYSFIENYANGDDTEMFDRAILLAPQFHDLESVVRCRYSRSELESLMNIQNLFEEGIYNSTYYFITFPVENGGSYESLTNLDDYYLQYVNSDTPSSSEYITLMKNNFDTVVGFNIASDYIEEDSYYKQDGNLYAYGEFLWDDVLYENWNLPAGTRVYIGYNIMTTDGGNYFYIRQFMFNLCQYYEQMRTVLIVSVILALISVIYLTHVSGRKVIKEYGEESTVKYVSEDIIVTWFDRIPLELILALIVGMIILPFAMGYNLTLTEILLNSFIVVPIISIYSIILYIIILMAYLSVVKRCKKHVVIKELLLVRLFNYIKGRIRSLRKVLADAGRKGWLEISKYIGIIAANVILVSLFWIAMLNGVSWLGIVVLAVTIAGDIFFLLPIIKYALGIDIVLKGTRKIAAGEIDTKIPLENLEGNCRDVGESVNSIREGLQKAVEVSIRDERMKAELITNVSHDIKTPLTSIINYVDLLKREDISNPKVKEYLDVLDQKSHRLKQLTEDLVEVSKASTGNIVLECMNIDFAELLNQAVGEFEDKFLSRNLMLIQNIPDESIVIYADGRRVFRVIENLFQNAYKYAMPGTRIYMDVFVKENKAYVVIKNISEAPLNISPDELTERFVRGDASRTTEGSGLGLSIAKNLTELHKGSFELFIEGDLFKAVVGFPLGESLVMSGEEKEEEDKEEKSEENDIGEDKIESDPERENDTEGVEE